MRDQSPPEGEGKGRHRMVKTWNADLSDQDQAEVEEIAEKILKEEPSEILYFALGRARSIFDHEFHGGAAGSFRSEGCSLCPEDEEINCSHAVNSDCPHYS